MNFKKHIKIREEKFGSVIFDTLREKVFVTNKTGAIILQFLKENKSESEIIGTLGSRYNEGHSAITGDVIGFIEELKNREILA